MTKHRSETNVICVKAALSAEFQHQSPEPHGSLAGQYTIQRRHRIADLRRRAAVVLAGVVVRQRLTRTSNERTVEDPRYE